MIAAPVVTGSAPDPGSDGVGADQARSGPVRALSAGWGVDEQTHGEVIGRHASYLDQAQGVRDLGVEPGRQPVRAAHTSLSKQPVRLGCQRRTSHWQPRRSAGRTAPGEERKGPSASLRPLTRAGPGACAQTAAYRATRLRHGPDLGPGRAVCAVSAGQKGCDAPQVPPVCVSP